MVMLPDVQNRADLRGVNIDRVGITNVLFPTKIRGKRNKMDESALTLTQETAAKIDLYVGLPHEYKGVNMSRFMECLLAFHGTDTGFFSCSTLPDLLKRLQNEMNSKDAYVRIEFDYFITKLSPVTQKPAPQGYRCAFTGIMKGEEYEFILEANVIAASLCVCSKEMSLLDTILEQGDSTGMVPVYNTVDPVAMKQVQETLKLSGIGSHVGMGAHNQRSQIRVQLTAKDNQTIWIEDIVDVIEKAASAPTYPLLKRPDERFVTEFAYNHPRFSEDIARELYLALENVENISQFSVKVRNEESIHPYDVVSLIHSPEWKY
jgi:GTP cyclohydrolase IB